MRYSIQGMSTILVWLRQHDRLDWNRKPLKKETPNKKIRELEKRLKRLEQKKEILTAL
jgi:hypothetical protein